MTALYDAWYAFSGRKDPNDPAWKGYFTIFEAGFLAGWNGGFKEGAAAASGEREPIDKISVPTKNRVRTNAPDTSFEAAIGMTPEKSRIWYERIYNILNSLGPKTDEEIAESLERLGINAPRQTVSPRRSELRDHGWVRKSGLKRPTRAGNPSIVWEAVPAGG